jgi:hypothetical protein
MARKAIRKKGKKYPTPIPLAEAKKIINDVNIHKREKGVSPPFKDQGYAISQLLSTIDLYNQTVDNLITNPALTPENQKTYYNKLNKRVSRLLDFLQEEPPEYLERIYMHQRDKRIPEQILQKFNKEFNDGLHDDITSILPITPKKLIDTLKAYAKTTKHLSDNPINNNRKNNHRDDLRHLIDLLFEMHIKCSGRPPGRNSVGEKVYKGDFVLLVKLVEPYVKLTSPITNDAIRDGVKLYAKYYL